MMTHHRCYYEKDGTSLADSYIPLEHYRCPVCGKERIFYEDEEFEEFERERAITRHQEERLEEDGSLRPGPSMGTPVSRLKVVRYRGVLIRVD
jgi:hypothetical protein